MLKLIAHGTDGTDGIEPGIHLRWGFNSELGFPPCFQLYRRKSDVSKHFCFPLEQLSGQIKKLPYSYIASKEPEFIFKVTTLATKPVKGDACKGTQVNGEMVIEFSKPVSRIEVECCLESKSDYLVEVHSKKEIFKPLHISGAGLSAPKSKYFSFDCVGATAIRFIGEGIFLLNLCTWICSEKGKNPWELINDDCGCGLPVYQKGTSYVRKNFPKLKDMDWATVLCRMQETELPKGLSPQSFEKLEPVIETVFTEGTKIPVGWNLYTPDTPSADQSKLSVGMYDSLLMQSFDVSMARLLGLYWLDRHVTAADYYDYKITATWPAHLMRRLDSAIDFNAYEADQTLFTTFSHGKFVFDGLKNPVIKRSPSSFLRAEQALVYSGASASIVAPEKTTEVQLFVRKTGSDQVVFEAYRNGYASPSDTQILNRREGIICLKTNDLRTIRISGGEVMIYRIRYTAKPFPEGEQQYIICGIKKEKQLALQIPQKLTATQLRGGSVNNSNGTVSRKNYIAGLRWNANEKKEALLLSIAPIAFNIRRRTGSDPAIVITDGSPVFIASSPDSVNKPPAGWPEKRQFYIDKNLKKKQYRYSVQGVDLFGRKSAFSDPVILKMKSPSPPPPVDVAAKYLDYTSYDISTDTFSDASLSDKEKRWLKNNGASGIRVNWKWTATLLNISPDVKGFHVHFQQGWLNVYKGTIESEPSGGTISASSLALTADELAEFTSLSGSTSYDVYKFKSTLDNASVAADAFRLCWMKQNGYSFLVLRNTSGSSPVITVLKSVAPLTGVPENDKGFAIGVTPRKSAFIDFREATAWTDTSVSANKLYSAIGNYEIFIKNPAFPSPAINASDIDKTRYAQIGVSAYTSDSESAVSTPSAIVAVYRTAPSTATLYDTGLDELNATAPDVHGKSTFYFRWKKQGNAKKYNVYRALDRTLHNVAKENDSSLGDYDSLTNAEWQIIAGKTENEQAFTRINSNSITEDDNDYEDRVTDIPAPGESSTYTPDSLLLLYADDTLDGTGSNRYFYRISVIDTNGLVSALSDSTPPVAIPVAKPIQAPMISAVIGGENKITLQWAIQPNQNVEGYLLYRTEDATLAGDWRRMDLLQADGESYSVNADSSLTSYSHPDETVVARTPYYYGIIAVNIAGDGSKLRSRMSVVKQGQAYDLTPPAAPEWDEENSGWVFVDADGNIYETEDDVPDGVDVSEVVRLVWITTSIMSSVLIQRKSDSENSWSDTANWISENKTLDRSIISGTNYSYRAKVRSVSGNMSLDWSTIEITS